MTWSPFEDGAAAPPQELWLQSKFPEEVIKLTFDTATLKPPVAIAGATSIAIQVAPSGDGELAITSLSVTGSILSFTETGGVGARVYVLLFTVNLSDSEILQFTLQQGVQNLPPFTPPGPPSSVNFGPPTTWMPSGAPRLDFEHDADSQYLL